MISMGDVTFLLLSKYIIKEETLMIICIRFFSKILVDTSRLMPDCTSILGAGCALSMICQHKLYNFRPNYKRKTP